MSAKSQRPLRRLYVTATGAERLQQAELDLAVAMGKPLHRSDVLAALIDVALMHTDEVLTRLRQSPEGATST